MKEVTRCTETKAQEYEETGRKELGSDSEADMVQ